MNAVLDLIANHAPSLLCGATLILAGGVAVGLVIRSPAYRQRWAELTVGASLVWIVAAMIPLPRASIEWPLTGNGVVHTTPTSVHLSDTSTSSESVTDDAGITTIPTLSPAKTGDAATRMESAQTLAAMPVLPADAEAPSTSDFVTAFTVAPVKQNPWPHGGAAVYLMGVAACVLWLFLGRVVLWHIERRFTSPAEWVNAVYAAIHGPHAQLLVSRTATRPFSHGVLRPRIVLPAELCDPDRRELLRHVLLHESAHIWRRDAWGNAVLNFALPILYVHPLYWLLARQAHFARELVADDWAARHGDRRAYVDHLVAFAGQVYGVRADALGLLGVLGAIRFRTSFYRRMTMLLDRETPLATHVTRRWLIASATTLGVATVLLAAIVGVTPADDQEKRADDTTLAGPPLSVSAEDSDTYHTACVVKAGQDVRLSARRQGFLAQIKIREGLMVKKGDVVAVLDDTEVKQKLRISELEIQKARLEASDVNVAYAKTAAEGEAAKFELVQRAAKDRAVSRTELERAKMDLERARAALEQSKVEADALRAERAIRESHLEAARAEYEQLHIVSPCDGIVVELFTRPGEYVKPGDPVCRVIDPKSLGLAAVVSLSTFDPEELVGRAVTARFTRARGKTIDVSAKITGYNPLVVTPVGGVRVWAEFENLTDADRAKILPGMQGSLGISTKR
jgi:multidrug efflux pump subunit AcrA (membrane-fusion protein)